jgi:hypothetical protein
MEIVKKAWPDYYEQVMNGNKSFDARLGDFAAEVGDVLILKEWDPKTQEYTGRELRRTITYKLHVPYTGTELWTQEQLQDYGLQVLSLSRP